MSNLFEHCRAGVSSASAKDTIKPSAEASASLIMPRRSIYDEVKDTIKPNAMQIYLLFAEAKYPPGVSQRYDQLRHLLLRVSKKNVTKGFLWCEVDRIVFFRIFASIGK